MLNPHCLLCLVCFTGANFGFPLLKTFNFDSTLGSFLPLARFAKYLGLGLLSFTLYELALRREGQVFN